MMLPIHEVLALRYRPRLRRSRQITLLVCSLRTRLLVPLISFASQRRRNSATNQTYQRKIYADILNHKFLALNRSLLFLTSKFQGAPLCCAPHLNTVLGILSYYECSSDLVMETLLLFCESNHKEANE